MNRPAISPRPGLTGFLQNFTGELTLFLAVLAARLGVLAYAGSPLPYYDQWLAEFNNTFLQLSAGGSAVGVLFTPHNEHVLATTKLLSVLGFLFNGYWDVWFLLVASAFVRAGEAAFVLWLLRGGRSGRSGVVLWVAGAALFGVPLSAYNALCGLQVSFFLAEVGMLASVACVVRWRSARSGAFGLVLGTLGGLLSLGSAVAIPVATLLCHLVVRRPRAGFWPAWFATVGLTAGYAVLALQAQQVALVLPPLPTRLVLGLSLVAWPFHLPAAGALTLAAGVAAMVLLRRHQGAWSAALGATVAIAGYGVTNAFLIALNRPPDDFHPRHWDTLSLIPFSVCVLLAAAVRGRWGPPAIALVLIGYGFGFSQPWRNVSQPYLASARHHREESLAHYRALLVSADLQRERDRLNAQLNARDYSFFDDPIGRFSLHPVAIRNILVDRPAALALFSPELVAIRTPSAAGSLLKEVVRNWWISLVLALAVWVGRRATLHDDSST